MSSNNCVEGYELTSPRYDCGPQVFVQRSTMRGRPWLRFLAKLDGTGYWVTAHKTLRDARK